jgi:GNAT superfamily N-acetyltransferase
VVVDPAWQRRGIGQALLAARMPFARERGFHKLHTDCKEDSASMVRFLERAGFVRIGIRFESALNMTTLELLASGIGITGMTGVLAEHRSQGVAMALNLASFRYLRAHAYTEARAHNDTANPPILAVNEKLGYRRLPGWLAWEKALQRDGSTITSLQHQLDQRIDERVSADPASRSISSSPVRQASAGVRAG